MKLYEKVQQMMAAKYATENYFGPVQKTDAEKHVNEMSKEGYEAYNAIHDKEVEMIRKGYNRRKEKSKEHKKILLESSQLLARAKLTRLRG